MGLNLWAFAAITVPLVATPGASTAVVLRNALAGGVRSGAATALGANTGSFCYGLLTAFGVSVALQRWPPVVARRCHCWYRASCAARIADCSRAHGRTRRAENGAHAAVDRPPISRSVREGFVTNMLNPSLATFYLLIVPVHPARGAVRRERADPHRLSRHARVDVAHGVGDHGRHARRGPLAGRHRAASSKPSAALHLSGSR